MNRLQLFHKKFCLPIWKDVERIMEKKFQISALKFFSFIRKNLKGANAAKSTTFSEKSIHDLMKFLLANEQIWQKSYAFYIACYATFKSKILKDYHNFYFDWDRIILIFNILTHHYFLFYFLFLILK